MKRIEDLTTEQLRDIVRSVQIVLWGDCVPATGGVPVLTDEGYPDWSSTSTETVYVLRPDPGYDSDTPADALGSLGKLLADYGLAPDAIVVLDATSAD